MVRESTLDEFGRDDGDESGAGGTDGPGGSDRDRPSAPITCEWTPDGADCDACGATVERRWRDGGARVCADCKEW